MRVERVTHWMILILIVGFLVQAVFSMWNDSPTFDEMINPSAGYAELITRDLRLVHDHPPLIRVFTALPLLAFNPTVPLDHDSWQRKRRSDRYDFAHQFFYIANDNADELLFWSRMSVVFLSLVLGLLVFKWAQELYGNLAGLFALFLYTFEPNIIAHSRLTTNDLILALFVFSTIYQFWQYCCSRSLKALILTGISLGLALISKFSAVMLFPMLFVLTFLTPTHSISKGDNRSPPIVISKAQGTVGFVAKLADLAIISVIAIGVVVLFYGSQWNLFIRGFNDTLAHYQGGHYTFFLGNYSSHGWWYYFPIAFLFKTPLPLLIYIIVSFLFLSFRKDKAKYFLLVPVGIILLAALGSHINIGIRHILPAYPFLIVLASSITTVQFTRPLFFSTCFGGLALWYLSSTLSIFPSYLAYFNEFVGPKRGYLVLVDSNLDWGQDLKRLKMFMDNNGIRRIYLSYFGTADPCYYGISFLHLSVPFFKPTCAQKPDGSQVDFIAISATTLQSVYLPDKKSFDWLKAYKPTAQIGYSIFVYDIKGDASAHNRLGMLYLSYRSLEDALNEFKLVVELTPKESTAHSNLGLAYAMLSMSYEAGEAFKKALKLDPENSVAKEGLKRIHSQPRSG